jgi:hypothetical protein
MPPEDYYERKFDKIIDSYLEMMSDIEKVKKIDRDRSIKYLALSALDYFNKYPN